MDAMKANELKRQAIRLRQIAAELRAYTPSCSTRVFALASELEIRASNIERGFTP